MREENSGASWMTWPSSVPIPDRTGWRWPSAGSSPSSRPVPQADWAVSGSEEARRSARCLVPVCEGPGQGAQRGEPLGADGMDAGGGNAERAEHGRVQGGRGQIKPRVGGRGPNPPRGLAGIIMVMAPLADRVGHGSSHVGGSRISNKSLFSMMANGVIVYASPSTPTAQSRRLARPSP